MASIDDELLLDAEDDARAVEYILNSIPQEVKERVSEDDIYYILDVAYDYYATSGVFDTEPDEEGYIDVDLDKAVAHILKKAKKEGFDHFEHDDVLFVLQAEMDYGEAEDEGE